MGKLFIHSISMDIEKALQFYAQNPEDPRKAQFDERLKMGAFDSQLEMAGFRRTANGIEKTGLPVTKQAVGLRGKQIFNPMAREKRVDILGDIKQFGSDFKQSAERRMSNIGETRQALQSGEIKDPEAIFQTVGQVAGLGADQIGNLFKLGVKAILPQKAEEATKQVVENLGEKVIEIPEVQSAINWYSNLDENQKRNVDAVGGIVSLASEFIGAGAGGRVSQTAKRIADKGMDVATTGVKRVSAPAARTATKIGAEIEGALTGTSAETLETAFDAVRRGGKSSEQFTAALRGELTPEQLAENLKSAIGTVKESRQTAFRESFEAIKDTPIKTPNILSGFEKELADANILVKNGVLDFSNSKLRTTPQAMNKLQMAYDEVKNANMAATLEQIDTSRQALKGLRLAGDDASANLANKFIDDATRIVRDTGKQVDGYEDMLNKFTVDSEFIEGLERGLSAGDRATIDQTYRRMTTALKTNNEARMNLLKELDEATGGTLLAEIAGQQLSEVMPRGIIRAFGASLVGAGVATGSLAVGATFLPTLVMASPRAVGEFVRVLGLSAQKTKVFMDAIKNARKTLSKTYNIPEERLGELFGVGIGSTPSQIDSPEDN